MGAQFFFTLEYLFKAGYGWVIGLGTHLSYEPEADKVYAVAKDPTHRLELRSDVKVLRSVDGYSLVQLPRYDRFRELLLQIQNEPLQFLEVSGNRKIFFTAIGEKSCLQTADPAESLGTVELPTAMNKKRYLISTDVRDLLTLMSSALQRGCTIEHVFDY